MNRKTALQEFANELHISHSQLFTYLNCSLKYRFQYVEHRPPERISIALPFGSAIHSAIEMYYRSLKNSGHAEPLEAIIGRFEDCLGLELDYTDVPVIFKKDMPDRVGAMAMGKAILKSFYESVDLSGQEIVEVGAHRRGIVEELEKAHIYIEQLHKQNKALETRLVKLEAIVARLNVSQKGGIK